MEIPTTTVARWVALAVASAASASDQADRTARAFGSNAAPAGVSSTVRRSRTKQSARIPDYDATVGPTRQMITEINGSQPGDPARAAAAILTALDAETTPLRLPLGDDAVDGILGHLDTVRDEIRAWEHLSRATAYAPA